MKIIQKIKLNVKNYNFIITYIKDNLLIITIKNICKQEPISHKYFNYTTQIIGHKHKNNKKINKNNQYKDEQTNKNKNLKNYNRDDINTQINNNISELNANNNFINEILYNKFINNEDKSLNEVDLIDVGRDIIFI